MLVTRFLLQCLEDLDSSLRKLNSRLFVIRGQPADVLPTLFKEWGTTYFTFEEDPEPIREKCVHCHKPILSRRKSLTIDFPASGDGTEQGRVSASHRHLHEACKEEWLRANVVQKPES